MNKKKLILNLTLPIISIGVIIGVWAIAAAMVGSELILPTIGDTLKKLIEVLSNPYFYSAFGETLFRSLISFVLSYLLAITLAILSVKYFVAQKLISPIIAIIRTLPTVAVVLLLLFWTSSKVAPIIVTMLVVFPTAYNQTISALKGIDKGQIEMLKVYKVKGREALFKVYLPQIAPTMLYNAGSGLSLNLKLMVAAEVLSQTANSMGYLLNTAKVYFETAEMIALVLFTVIVGILIEAVFTLISSRVAYWK